MTPLMTEMKKNMEKAVEHLRSELSKLRVGRASATMVDSVRVDVYGSQMSLKEVAALATPDPKTITIQPWDRSLFGEIEKAILAANLGLTPMNDGKIIRINMPPITEERRKDFVKQISKEGEAAKVAVRNIRRESMDALKKDKALTEDDQRRTQDEIQKLTDQFIQDIDKAVDSKTKEVMTI
ncbi:MAG: ribosome recycling factor [Proteobacteria bacterium]|nr:ribosome recycling factor [Pseudomonadota bacterium]